MINDVSFWRKVHIRRRSKLAMENFPIRFFLYRKSIVVDHKRQSVTLHKPTFEESDRYKRLIITDLRAKVSIIDYKKKLAK